MLMFIDIPRYLVNIMSRNTAFLQIANIAAFVMTVSVNSLASTLALNGRTTGEISDLYPTLITPAGYVFSIWGLIYALLLVFTVFQALPRQRETPFLRKVGFLFVLSGLFNVSWLFLWHYLKITLSVIPMFALLASLIAIYLRLRIGKSNVSLRERLCVHLPFSVYLGWITIASIADVAAALVSVNWEGWGLDAVTWSMLMIVAALAITLVVMVTRRDAAYGLVVVWALLGIIVKQGGSQGIVIAAGTGVAIVAAALVIAILSSDIRR